jgi:hypothetical protein
MTKTQINQLITDNKEVFTQGAILDEAHLCELMDIEIPRRFTRRAYDTFNFAKLTAYCQLNRYLSKRGLVIAQRQNGAEYHVLEGNSIPRQVAKLEKLASDKLRNAAELESGLTQYKGKWKKLTKRQLKEVRDYQNDVRRM